MRTKLDIYVFIFIIFLLRKIKIQSYWHCSSPRLHFATWCSYFRDYSSTNNYFTTTREKLESLHFIDHLTSPLFIFC